MAALGQPASTRAANASRASALSSNGSAGRTSVTGMAGQDDGSTTPGATGAASRVWAPSVPHSGSQGAHTAGTGTVTAASAGARFLRATATARPRAVHISRARQTAAPVDALALVAFCLWCFVVALAGGTLGLVLGNIRLPAVLLVASSPAAGAGANIGVSGVAALTAAIAHIRAGRINWRLFAWMAPPSMVGAVVGGLVSGAIPDTALLLVIGATLFYFGVDLLRRKPRPRGGGDLGSALDIRAAVVSGALIGLLGGLVGLILGTLRMPALLRWVGEAPAKAVGTNLAVGFWVGLAGVAGHLPGGVDWSALGIGAAASIPGALLGARLTGRLSEQQLLRGIGAILVVAGVATALQALI